MPNKMVAFFDTPEEIFYINKFIKNKSHRRMLTVDSDVT